MPVQYKLTKEQKIRIAKLRFEEGVEPQALAERFGVARNTIYNVLAMYKKERKDGFRNADKGGI